MPFTLSHPAAILPIHIWSKSRLPLAALAIGSMSPDFAYFLPYEWGKTSHTLLGIFTFCWPAGMLTWLLFEYLLKEPTIVLLPENMRARLNANMLKPNARLFVLVSIALFIGAATHIVWDAFTHATSPFAEILPELRAMVFEFRGRPVPLYKLLQHGSTIIGLVAIAAWMFSRWKDSRHNTFTNYRGCSSMVLSNSWRVGAIAIMILVSLCCAVTDWRLHPSAAIERQLFYLAIGGMAGFAVAWCGVAIATRRVARVRNTSTADTLSES